MTYSEDKIGQESRVDYSKELFTMNKLGRSKAQLHSKLMAKDSKTSMMSTSIKSLMKLQSSEPHFWTISTAKTAR